MTGWTFLMPRAPGTWQDDPVETLWMVLVPEAGDL